MLDTGSKDTSPDTERPEERKNNEIKVSLLCLLIS